MPDGAGLGLEAQLAVIRTDLSYIKDHITNGHADHESRLRKLEQFKYVMFGACAVVSGGVSGVVSQLK